MAASGVMLSDRIPSWQGVSKYDTPRIHITAINVSGPWNTISAADYYSFAKRSTGKMVLKLYGSAMSTSRVLVTILEKELPYELVLVAIAKGEQKAEDYKKLQPFGKVPVLDDDGFIMFESRAICKYLARKYHSGKKLIPEDDEAYGRFEQACSIEQSYFAAAAETIGTELVVKPMKGLGVPDMERVAQAEQELDAVLAVYDKKLATQRYIAGDELTLADLFHLPNGAAALMAGKWKEVFAKYPHVDKWFKELQRRETWAKAAAKAGTIP